MNSRHRAELRTGCLVLAAWLLWGAVARTENAPDPVPVPDAAALAGAESTLKDVYKEEFQRATTTDQMLALARTLLEQGLKAKNDTAEKYALYQAALNLGVASGNVDVAFEAIDATATAYRVDTLKLKIESLTRILKLSADAKKRQQQLQHVLALVGAAVDVDSYDLAKQVLTTAISAARSARDPDHAKQFVLRLKELETQEKALDKVEAALKTLETQPTDPLANSEVGRFRCLYQGDWATGLPMLALSADPKLGPLAQRELSDPKTSAEHLKLADDWWDLAQKETGAAKKQLQKHAGAWYAAAAPGLDGLLKTKAEKRLAEVGGNPTSRPIALPILLAKVKPLYYDDFSNPNSGFVQINQPDRKAQYQGGKFCLEMTSDQKSGMSAVTPWTMSSGVVCRFTAQSFGSPRPSWGIILSNSDRKASIGLHLDSDFGVLFIDRGFDAFAGPTNRRFEVPAINKGAASNTLIILARGKNVELYVNGAPAGEPFTIDNDIWPANLYVRGSFMKQGRVEFQEIAIWPADKLPVVRPSLAR